MNTDSWVPPSILVAVDLVIFTLRDTRLQVLLVERGVPPFKGSLALPGGFLNHTEEDLRAVERMLSRSAA